jgi:hypothetical protein
MELRIVNQKRQQQREQLLVILCLQICIALQQQTAGFNLATQSREMQWSP